MTNKIIDLENKRLSPSAINSYYYCPRQFYTTYIEGNRSPDTIHTIRGKAVHHACEHIFDDAFIKSLPNKNELSIPMVKAEVQRLFKESWDSYSEKLSGLNMIKDDINKIYSTSAQALNEFSNRITNDALVLLDKGKVKRFNTAFKRRAPTFRELWLEDIDIKVGGFIDSVQHDIHSDEITIIDYKTSMKQGEIMPLDYRRQLSIYAYMYNKRHKNEPAKYVGIHYILENYTILLEITDNLIDFAIETVEDVRKKITAAGMIKENYSDMCRFRRPDGKWIEYKWKGI